MYSSPCGNTANALEYQNSPFCQGLRLLDQGAVTNVLQVGESLYSLPSWKTGCFYFFSNMQGCGSGSAWIRINFPSWIRIPEENILKYKKKKCREIGNKCIF